MATASDLCGDVTITYTDTIFPGGCSDAYIIKREWTATDACGLTSTCLQTIEVQDTIPPVIVCPGDVQVACGASIDTSHYWKQRLQQIIARQT